MSGEKRPESALDIRKPNFRDFELHGGLIEDLYNTEKHQKHIAERTEWAEQGAPVFCTTGLDESGACQISYSINKVHTADMAYANEQDVSLYVTETKELFKSMTLEQAIAYVKSLGYSQKSA